MNYRDAIAPGTFLNCVLMPKTKLCDRCERRVCPLTDPFFPGLELTAQQVFRQAGLGN
jgi:hypothetical protein